MKKKLIALMGAALLGLTVFAGVAGIAENQVTAAEDERFRIHGSTLTAYLGTDTFVSIPDTIKVIGDNAFEGKDQIVSIEIPEGVTTISYNAFKGCTALTGVILPDSVTKIGPGAFEGCTALTSVQIGKNVKSWGTGVFTNCDKLASVSIDSENEYLTAYNGAIYNGNMTMLYQVLPAREGENYAMPNTVRNMDTYAFWNLKNTKHVKIADGVTTIPKYSMSNMGTVEDVSLPTTVTAISERAFANNSALKQVAIPSSVRDIDDNAFAGSPNLQIFTSKDSGADKFGQEKGIPVTYQSAYPTDFMDSNANLDVKPNVGTEDNNNQTSTTPDSSSSTEPVTEPETSDNSSTSGSNNTANGETPIGGAVSVTGYIHPLDVPEASNVIGKTVVVAGKAVILMNNRKPTVYGVPDDVRADIITQEQERQQNTVSDKQETDDSTSADNMSDKTENTNNISDTADSDKEESSSSVSGNSVSGNTASAEITPSSNAADNTAISSSVQAGGSSYHSDEVIPQRQYYRQKNLKDFQIDNSIKSIGRLAFAESGLESIDIPESVKEIEYGAFMNCASLEDITIPDTVERIGTKAFAGTQWMKNWMELTGGSSKNDFLIVGDGILLAYRGTEITHISIPDGVKQIGSEAFKDHTEIINVDIPESVTKICAEAFRNCSSLTGLTGCKGLRTVIRGAFYGTYVSEADFHN
ncbi:MAG: leucine-rich repeat domain-containing protein [Lachnospiraceae bacterium]|jgi:hypothetical protein|nr:leucine-rich repeat domain-containing protein [Lachnospiraceae bacterium]